MAAALAQNPAPSALFSLRQMKRHSVPVAGGAQQRLVTLGVFPSHAHSRQTDGGLFTQHKRAGARLSLNAGGFQSLVDFHDCTEILENLMDSPRLCI